MNGQHIEKHGGPNAAYVCKADGQTYRGKSRKAARLLDASVNHWNNIYVPKCGARGHAKQVPGSLKHSR
jgi:hypothetical protein